MKLSLAQLNVTIGDIAGNVALIREAVDRAVAEGADLLAVPELVISGYPPKDLLLRQGFVEACDRAVEQLATEIPAELGLLVGHPTHRGLPPGQVGNGASLLHGGRVAATVLKMLLPNYDVFDERRYFQSAREEDIRPIEFGGVMLGVHICEDAWWGQPGTYYHEPPELFPNPVKLLAERGADLLINLSASPFEIDKPGRRENIVASHVMQHQRPYGFVNQIGGNDDLVFDGHSFAMNAQGRVICRLAGFEPDQTTINTDDAPLAESNDDAESPDNNLQMLLDALVLGLRDYMQKSGFTDCVLGLSGGIDSALAAYIAGRAMGPAHVHALLMPSRYSSDHSVSDAQTLAETMGLDWEIIPIDKVHTAYEQTDIVGAELAENPGGLPEQNLQARIRGAIVMLRSNHHGWMALATGNKSELAVGYCTLYGDMAGGFAVLADVFKRDVYALSRYINEVVEGREVIPNNIINKAPSAELAPNQFDQDSLPPYPVLDAILEGLIEDERSPQSLAKEHPPEIVKWVVQKLDRNEFKRRQMPPGIKLSERAFGSGRRMPMAARIEVEV